MSREWNKLDNAAKIFPAADGGADMQVFRFSCELMEEIEPSALQKALDETLEMFDVYRYVMLRGFFWYYLERSDIAPVVREEYKPPCAALYHGDGSSLMFEVTYFNCRINLEVYHVLSDGTGAMQFLRTLVTKYLCIRFGLDDIIPDYDASRTQMKDDSFSKYYSSSRKASKQRMKKACRLKGARLSENRLNIITGRVSADKVLDVSKEHGVTLTAFLCSCLAEAISEEISARAKKRDVVLAIPVNLRKFFPSESARNFFLLVFAGYNFSKNSGEFNDILKKISSDLKENLTPEKLSGSLNAYSAVEHNFFAKITPLRLKDVFLRYAYQLSMLQSTATVSNIGIVKMPPALDKYIRAFDIYTGTNKLQMCLCTYNGILSINFSTPLVSTDIQRRFFRKLTALGVEAEVFSNTGAEEDA